MANKRIDIELGVKDLEGGAITRFSRRLQTAFSGAEQATDGVNRKLTTLDMAVAKLPASFQRAGGLAAAALERVGSASDLVHSRVRRLGSDLGGVLSGLTSGARALWSQLNSVSTALAGLGLALIAKGFLDTASSIEKTKTLLTGLMGSAKAAEDAFSWMMNQDFTRVFGLPAISDAFVKLRSAGIDPTKGSLAALTNALAAFGKGPEDLKLATVAIQQMAGKGVISMEELRQQLAERIPTAGKIMARELGMSYADMVAQISKGNLGAQAGLNALFAGLLKDYQGSVVALSNTWEGLGSRLAHWWVIFREQTMQEGGLFQWMKGELQGLLNWIDEKNSTGELTQWAKNLGESVKETFQTIKGWVTSATGWWRAHGESVKSIVTNLYQTVTNILQAAANVVEPVLAILVPKADRMQGAVQGYQGIAEQIKRITDYLNSVPPWVWQALMGAYVGGRLAGGQGAAVGAVGAVVVPRAFSSMPEPNKTTGGVDPFEWTARFLGFTTTRMQLERDAQERAAQEQQAEVNRLLNGSGGTLPAYLRTSVAGSEAIGSHFLEPEAATAKKRTEDQLRQVAELRDKISQMGLKGRDLDLKKLEEERREWLNKTGNDVNLVDEYIRKKTTDLHRKWEESTNADISKTAASVQATMIKDQQDAVLLAEKWDKNRLDATRKVELEIARNSGDTRKLKEIELQQYEESLLEYTKKEKGYVLSVDEVQSAVAAKRVALNKTSLDKMIDDWADFGSGWTKIGENFLEGVQSSFASTFRNIFEGVGSAWESLWAGMKDISYNALAAIATKVATWGLGNLLVAAMPSLKGIIGGEGGSQANTNGTSWGGLASLASAGKGAYDAISGAWSAVSDWGNSALNPSLWGTPAGLGSGLVNWQAGTVPAGFMGPPSPVAGGLSGLGYVTSGIGGALTGWQLAQMLYGSGTGSQVGGALGGGAGGIGGAMLGTMIMPGVGTVIGGLLGGLGGGALGGGLGSLFDSEDNRLSYEIPGNYQAHWEELSSRVDDYSQAVQDGTISQENFLAEMEKMAPLAAGAGEYLGDYGAIIGGTIEKLSGLTFGTEEYARVVQEELDPAWLIEQGRLADVANGTDGLAAATRALTNGIDALAASSSLSAEQQSGLIDLIINQSGSVADLSAKYSRYNEIKEQLTHAHEMERGQVEALGAELRTLHDELGINDSAMDNLNKTVNKLSEAVDKLAGSLQGLPEHKTITIDYEDNYNSASSYHTGGMVYHSGGLVSSAAARRLGSMRRGFSRGLVPRMHSGGAWPGLSWDERPSILQLGEHVTRRSSVNERTRPVLDYINRTGQVPQQAAAAGGSPTTIEVNLHTNGPMVQVQGGEVDPQALAVALGPALVQQVKAGLKEASRNGEVVVFAEGVALAER